MELPRLAMPGLRRCGGNMIGWLILAMLAALAAIVIYAAWLNARARRDRASLRHITGARQWWGRR